MKTLVTLIGSFCTTSAIADAVMGYGTALARARRIDTVDIPFVAGDGVVKHVELRIGWLIDTAAIFDGRRADDLIDAGTSGVIRAKTRRLLERSGLATAHRTFTPSAAPDVHWDEII